jgi:S1-C subfamily serine protease
MMKNLLILFSCLLLIAGCKTVEDTKNSEPEYATGIENIKHNLEKNKIDLFEAYVEANRYLSKLETDDPKIEETKAYVKEITADMDVEAKRLYDGKNYDKALQYTLSLNTINAQPTIPIKEVFEKLYNNLDATTDSFTRNKYKEQMIDLGVSSDSEIFDFLKYYYDNKSPGFFIYYFTKYTNANQNLVKEYPELNKYFAEMKNFSSLNLEGMMDSVVTVILKKGMNIKNGMGYFDNSLGTGFFIDDNGYILTNHHVIADNVDPKYQGYSAVYVTLHDDPDVEIPAKVVGYDKVFDVALLKIPDKNKKHLTLGRSIDTHIGDKIFTIGNPFGINYITTSGIIGNKDIEGFQLGRAFHIDAPINPGNSGGPLIDERGQVIGIVYAGLEKGKSEGINFAIPFQWVIKTIPYLYKGGEVKRCWVGGGLYNEKNKTTFYYILPSGPLAKAGVKTGDILKKIDDIEVATTEDAQNVLAWQSYPRLIRIDVERDGKPLSFIVRPEERPYLPVTEAFNRDTQGKLLTLFFGLDVEYYDNSILFKKYKVNKVYKRMLGQLLDIGEGDSIYVYDLKYMEKEKAVLLTIRFKRKEFGFVERVATVPVYAEINTIL